SEEDFKIAEHIIHNINDDGFLEESLDKMLENTDFDSARSKEILKIIHRLDPVGCGTSSTKEALMVQAEHLDETPFSLVKIIELHLEDLYRNNFDLIQK